MKNKSKLVSAILVLVLAGIALIVAVGKFMDKTMWFLIFLYWAVLTVKNIVDFIGVKNGK